MIGEKEWCPDCRRRVEIADEHTEVAGESASYSYTTREVEYWVIDFICGHTVSWKTGRSTAYRDPGA